MDEWSRAVEGAADRLGLGAARVVAVDPVSERERHEIERAVTGMVGRCNPCAVEARLLIEVRGRQVTIAVRSSSRELDIARGLEKALAVPA